MDLSPIWISLKTAVAATCLCFIGGLLMARWRVRRRTPVLGFLDGVLMLPVALPPTVVGLVLLLIFGTNSPVGRTLETLGLSLIFTWPAAVLAASVVAFPIMYQTARGAFLLIDPTLLDAARIFGLSEWRILWTVMLPLAWPGVAAGAILTFLRALGEFGATLMIAGNIPGRTQTAPVAIFFGIEAGDWREPVIWASIIFGIAVSVITLLNWLSRRADD